MLAQSSALSPPAPSRAGKPFRLWQPGEKSLFPGSGSPWVGVEARGGMAELPWAGMGCPGFPPCRTNWLLGGKAQPLCQLKHLPGAFSECSGGMFGHSSASVPQHHPWEHEVLHPSCTERIVIRYLVIKQRNSGLCGAAGSHPAQQQQPVGSLKGSPVWEKGGQAGLCPV